MTRTHRKKPDAANTDCPILIRATAYQAELSKMAHPSRGPLNADGHKHMVRGPISLQYIGETTEEADARPAFEHSQRTDPQNPPKYLALADSTFSDSTQGVTGAPPSAVPLTEN